MPSTDITFCMADCFNTDCFRHSRQLPSDNERPVSFADFSPDCHEYVSPETYLKRVAGAASFAADCYRNSGGK